MNLGDILSLALADADAKLRLDRPDWFSVADAIKAQPDWKPFATFGTAIQSTRVWCMKECGWCGEDFVTERRTGRRQMTMTCSPKCGQQFRSWKRRRQFREWKAQRARARNENSPDPRGTGAVRQGVTSCEPTPER